MAARRLNYYLIKTIRVTGWILLVLMPLYIVTGFAMRGDYGFSGLVKPRQALTLHRIFRLPLVAVFLVHALPSTYLAIRRWTSPRRKTRT